MPTRPHLRLVGRGERRQERSPLRAVGVSLGVLALVLIAQLFFSIAIQQGAYEVAELEAEQLALDRQQTALEESVALLSSPQNLASSAAATGMVPGESFPVLDTATATVVGTDTTVGAPINPALVSNEAANPTGPNPANPNAPVVSPEPGVSPGLDGGGDVASATDLDSPSTR